MENEIISQIRSDMLRQEADVLLLADADPHLSEYPADEWKERSWISGFNGSNGIFVITAENLLLWTDSRYELQAKQQLESQNVDIIISTKLSDVRSWILQHVKKPKIAVAFRGVCFSARTISLLVSECFSFKSVDFCSKYWLSRPQNAKRPIFVFPEKYAGQPAAEKLKSVRAEMRRAGTETLLVSALDEVAWLLNVRGTDIAYNPLAEAFVVLSQTDCRLFSCPEKITLEVAQYFAKIGVGTFPLEQLSESLSAEKIWADLSKTNYDIFQKIKKHIVRQNATPVAWLKSVKNETEIAGIERACLKDGVALVKFHFWLEKSLENGTTVDELMVQSKLREFRSQQSDFQGESFATIASYAAHGAIVHYTPTRETNVPLRRKNFLLIDSGGQYFDGTTDITRTVALGPLSARQKRDYTLVLKGNIKLASAIFPDGTTGAHLDVLARQSLWADGLNFGHGTGHGIGHFLNVHEGLQNIRPDQNPVALKPGMLTSDEPGVYREGQYGIRLENMILTEEHTKTDFGTFFRFRTMTLFPFDLAAIDASLLAAEEIRWLNDYHKKVRESLLPFLNDDEKKWLIEKTQSI